MPRLIKTPKEIALLVEGGKRLAFVLGEVAAAVAPGVTTRELDARAERLIRKQGGTSSFKGYRSRKAQTPYPATLCTSVNDEIVHAIPSERILREGDIIGLDIGMVWEGLYTDTALTAPVGTIAARARALIDATKKALEIGIAQVREGATTGDIGAAIEQFLQRRGFGVVRELVGHGVGYTVHEDPEVPNWGTPGAGVRLEKGMVLALEPMATEGASDIVLAKDGWAWKTKDGSISAHFEHTIVVEKGGARVLTFA